MVNTIFRYQLNLEQSLGFKVHTGNKGRDRAIELLVDTAVKEVLNGQEQETVSFDITFRGNKLQFTRFDGTGTGTTVDLNAQLTNIAIAQLGSSVAPDGASWSFTCNQVNASNLQDFINPPAAEGSKEDFFLTKLIRTVQKFFLFHFEVYPNSKRQLNNHIQNLSREEMLQVYRDPTSLYDEIFNELEQRHNNLYELFTREEIVELLDQKLLSAIRSICNRNDFQMIEKYELETFDAERALARMKVRAEHHNSTSATLNIYSDDADRQYLQAQPAKNIPFSALANVPITDENKEFILSLWKNNLVTLLQNCETTNSRFSGPQLESAKQYLEARRVMPDSVKEEFETLLEQLDSVKTLDKVKICVVSTSLSENISLVGYENELQESYTLYTDEILPVIRSSIQKAFYKRNNDNSEASIDENVNAGRLLAALKGDTLKKRKNAHDHTNFHAFNVDKITSKLIEDNDLGLFHNEVVLREFVYKELETEAEKTLKLHPRQLASLREYRNKKHIHDNMPMYNAMIAYASMPDSPLVAYYLAAIAATVTGTIAQSFEKKSLSELLYNEDTIIEIEFSNENYTNSTGLTSKELAGLLKVSQVMAKFEEDKHYKVSTNDLRILRSFYKHVKGNSDFNQRLKVYTPAEEDIMEDLEHIPLPGALKALIRRLAGTSEKRKIPPFGINQTAVEFIRGASFKSKDLPEYEKTVRKAERLMDKIRKKEAIPPTLRLSRKELGILINLRSMGGSQVSKFEKLGMNETFGFQHLKGLTERATTALNNLESHVQKDYDQHFHSGDIGGINGQYKEEVRGRKLPPFDYWTAKLFRYTHGEVVFKNESGAVGISEIYRKHQYHDLDLNEVITTDFYRINVSKLFSPQMTQQMKVVYGDDWMKVVQEKFEKHVDDVHINGEFSSFENDGERMVNAGRAHYDWILRHFVDAEIKNEYEGYRGQKKRNYDKVAEDFVNGGQSRDMFCSEFATRSTIAALVFLNKEIAGDVTQHFNYQNAEEILKVAGTEIPEDVQKLLERKESSPSSRQKLCSLLQSAGQSKKDSWLMTRIAANRIFDLPYDEHEKLKRVHPGRMVSLLQEKGVVEKVALPPKLAEILAQ